MVHEINKLSTPAIPSIQLYDSGAQNFTTAGEFHTWDTIAFKTTDFHYTADDDRVIIQLPSTGYYEVIFECSFKNTSMWQLVTSTSQLYLNGEVVSGAKAVGCSGFDTAEYPQLVSCACITLHFILYLNANDYIQIKTTTATLGDMDSVANTSRLIVKFIPTRGWNNSSGGNLNYKGEVMR